MIESNFYKATVIDVSRERKNQTSMPSQHYHDGYEIFYLVSGDITYFIEDKVYHVIGGVLVLIKVNEIHKLVNSSGATFERITLLFKKEFLSDLFQDLDNLNVLSRFDLSNNIMRLKGSEQVFIENLFDKMVREFTEQPEGYQYYLKTLLFELLIFIKRKAEAAITQEESETNLVNNKINQILDYINRHYDQRLTINEITKRFYISQSYFCKLFRDNTGFSFTEYLNNVRIKESRLLLKDSKNSVTEIAEKVGFDSSTHFGRVFKEITRLSPLKYRNASRSNR